MRSFPFDAVFGGFNDKKLPILDRDYNADDLAEVYKAFYSNGIFANYEHQFSVTKSGDPTKLNVSAGWCMIQGRFGWEKNATTLDISPASYNNQRCDIVVLRLDLKQDARDIQLHVIEGIPQPGYIRPDIYRNDTVYDLAIAEVHLDPNGTVTIIDTRYDSSKCGIVTPRFNIDLTEFNAQVTQALNDKVSELDEATQEALKAMQDALSGATAGNLQNQIDEIKKDGWVTSERIKDGEVKTADIANGAVSLDKLAANSVNSSKIVDGSIATADLASKAVTVDKLGSLELFKSVDVPISYTVAANSAQVVTGTYTCPSGYVPIGILWFSSNSTQVVPYAVNAKEAGKVQLSVRNLSTGQVSANTYAGVGLIRNL